MQEDDRNVRETLQSLVAGAAESLDGVSLIVEDMAEDPSMPRGAIMRLAALRDVVDACRDRMDRAADLLDV